MHVVIMGAGAVGSFLGWAVAAGGGRTTLVRRRFAGSPGAREPLTVVRPDGSSSMVVVTLAAAIEALEAPPDLVIVAVRQYDLPDALNGLGALPRVAVLTAQNGVGAEEAAVAALSDRPLLAASITASLERAADGTVHWLRSGGVGLAPVAGGAAGPLGELTRTLRRAGLRVGVHRDARAMKWSKLVANLVGNATSGLLDLDPTAIYRDRAMFDIERAQLREALAVMRAKRLRPVFLPGAPVPLLALAAALPAPLSRAVLIRAVGSARGGKDPSLRGAVQSGSPTETGWLNGAVARAGAATGVPTPVNAALARLVDEVAASEERRAWFRHRPDRLRAEIGALP